MKAIKLQDALDRYARSAGVKPLEPHYIWGEFKVSLDGEVLYSDEGHEYCEACADTLLAKVLPLLPADEREDHRVSATTCGNEDTSKSCLVCGALLDYQLNDTGAENELDNYKIKLPSYADLQPGEAFHIARIVEALPKDRQVLALARAAVARIPTPAA